MEIKYTKDGRKVVVIGKLNNHETIVQEIFVKEDGTEIPGGENFVVTGLVDEYVISYKEKRLKEIEEKTINAEKSYNATMKSLRKKEKEEMGLLRAKLEMIRGYIKNINIEAFDMVEDFLMGNYKYYILERWNPEIKEFNLEEMTMGDDECLDFKLISLCGRSNGDLAWRINEYFDGSGFRRTMWVFKGIEEAKEKLKEIIESYEKYSIEQITELKKWNIPLNVEKHKLYFSEKIDTCEKKIKRLQNELEDNIQTLNTTRDGMNEIT